MILAVDVCYKDTHAVAAGVLFERWEDEFEQSSYSSTIQQLDEYIPGQFYKRELPCILRLLNEHSLSPTHIVIDGFVCLDGKSQPGLGKYLYEALQGRIVVIGVAKKPFKGITHEYELYRGASKRPLYVTGVGEELSLAKNHVNSMHGHFRIPTLLKKVDQLCRESI